MSTVERQLKKGGEDEAGEEASQDGAAGGASKSKAQLRAERRAVQEAQRAAKAAGKPAQQLQPQPQQKQKQQQKQKPGSGEGGKPEAKQEKPQQQKPGSGEGGKPEAKQEKPQQSQSQKPASSKCGKVDAKKDKQQKQPQSKAAADSVTKQQLQQAGGNKKKTVAPTSAAGPPLPSFFRHLEAPLAVDQLTGGLYTENFSESQIEPAFVQLALMVAHGQLQGPSARCLGLARALRQLLGGVPSQDLPRLLKRKLDPNMRLLRTARPLTVMETCLEQSLAGWVQEGSSGDNSEDWLLDRIDKFVEEQIDKARSTMATFLASKMKETDASIMLYKPSSLIFQCLEEIVKKLPHVSIILLDTPPSWEGQAFLRRLRAHPKLSACPVRYALLSAAPSLLSDTGKVVLEGHALTANGNVLAPVGTAYLANVAWSHRVPCLVLCHDCQTWDKVLIDSMSYNELGRVGGESQLCNVQYDLTPGDLVTALITERGLLPCTGSPVLH